jgi:hypothetical protein
MPVQRQQVPGLHGALPAMQSVGLSRALAWGSVRFKVRELGPPTCGSMRAWNEGTAVRPRVCTLPNARVRLTLLDATGYPACRTLPERARTGGLSADATKPLASRTRAYALARPRIPQAAAISRPCDTGHGSRNISTPERARARTDTPAQRVVGPARLIWPSTGRTEATPPARGSALTPRPPRLRPSATTAFAATPAAHSRMLASAALTRPPRSPTDARLVIARSIMRGRRDIAARAAVVGAELRPMVASGLPIRLLDCLAVRDESSRAFARKSTPLS